MPSTARTTRTAVYMHISKDDGSQDPDNQLRVLREEAERAGEEVGRSVRGPGVGAQGP